MESFSSVDLLCVVTMESLSSVVLSCVVTMESLSSVVSSCVDIDTAAAVVEYNNCLWLLCQNDSCP